MTYYIFFEGLEFATYSLEPIYELFNLIIWKLQILPVWILAKLKGGRHLLEDYWGIHRGWMSNKQLSCGEGRNQGTLKVSAAGICGPSRESCYSWAANWSSGVLGRIWSWPSSELVSDCVRGRIVWSRQGLWRVETGRYAVLSGAVPREGRFSWDKQPPLGYWGWGVYLLLPSLTLVLPWVPLSVYTGTHSMVLTDWWKDVIS